MGGGKDKGEVIWVESANSKCYLTITLGTGLDVVINKSRVKYFFVTNDASFQ